MRIVLSLLAFSLILYACDTPDKAVHQKPTGVIGLDDESEEKRLAKEEYLAKLYYADAGTNVDSIREENLRERVRLRKARRAMYNKNQMGEIFANGYLEGNWHERGPNNEAGDMRELAYDPQTNDLYALSVGRHLWKGNLNGQTWTLLNDDVRFELEVLELCHTDTALRLFASFGTGIFNKVIKYSDDYGQTWTNGTGFSFYDGWGRGRKMIKVNDSVLYYLVHTWQASPWGKVMQIYETKNSGETYTKIWNSNVGYDGEDVDIWKPRDSDTIMMIDNRLQDFGSFYFDVDSNSTVFNTMTSYAGSNVPIGGIHLGGYNAGGFTGWEYFIIHDQTDEVFKKNAFNTSWTYLSTCPENVWRKGWMVNPNTGELYVGGFQLNKSADGLNWQEQYPYWWTYYADSKDSMHVDIMHMKYFEDQGGTPFFIVLNHAGVYVSWDNFNSTQNLGLNDLNVVTLYDQTTSSDGYLYGGAQDKGNFLFRGDSKANFNIVATDNLTTGDGMIGEFINGNQTIVSMIQMGTVGCLADRATGSISNVSWYTIPGTDKPGWINPMVGTADTTDNTVYMAGGNLNGGAGSYLIKMDININGSNVQWLPTQFNYDFKANSHSGNAVIKAIGVSQMDYNRIYVATEDASFFVSTNEGSSWTKMPASLPSGMIPWEIISSATDQDIVYICGTGFSNAGVFVSQDGGQSFQPLALLNPQATYHEMALSDNEDLLFTASSNGPYVFHFNDQTWYPLTGANTPIVDFNTVDNIGDNIIRFGTYGRGVWDFEIERIGFPVSLEGTGTDQLHVYPNPAVDEIFVDLREGNSDPVHISIYDVNGRQEMAQKFTSSDSGINVRDLKSGIYFLKVKTSRKDYTAKFIKR